MPSDTQVVPDRWRPGPFELIAPSRRPTWRAVSARLACVAAVTSAFIFTGPSVATTAQSGTSSSSSAAIAAAANWILAHEQPDGAILAGGSRGSREINPYLANYAAMGLARAYTATGDESYLHEAWSELHFYAASEQPITSYVSDYREQSHRAPVSIGSESSTDSYAATFLVAAWSLRQVTGGASAGEEAWLAPAVDGAFEALMSTEQADGLFYAKPGYDVSLLTDDAEDFGGLTAATDLFRVTGEYRLEGAAAQAAAALHAAVERLMWDPRTGSFDWGWSPSRSDPSNVSAALNPDAMSQIWAVAYGLATPTQARALVSQVGSAQPAFDRENGSAATFPISLWALRNVGQQATATAEEATISETGEQGGWSWPFTTGDGGQLILAESGGLNLAVASRPSRPEIAESELPSEVNEEIGTIAGGNTSEAAAAPFGMIEFGPQLPDPYDTNFAPGRPIAGLSLTNVDGVGCPLFGDVPILPVSGPVGSHPGTLTSAFTTTSAEPGSWAGTVGSVAVSAAATTRTAIATLQFPGGEPANLVVKADADNGNVGFREGRLADRSGRPRPQADSVAIPLATPCISSSTRPSPLSPATPTWGAVAAPARSCRSGHVLPC